MDKNTIIGFVLIALVLIGFNYYSRPSKEEQQRIEQHNDSVQKAQQKTAEMEQAKEAAIEAKAQAVLADSTSAFFSARQGNNTPVVLQNKLVKLTLSPKGGVITEAELISTYKNQQGGNVMLFDAKDAKMKFMFAGKSENLISSDLYFTPTNVTDSTVTMQVKAANGGVINFNYKLLPESYMVNFTVNAQGMANFFPPTLKTMDIDWTEQARQQEKGFSFENRYASLTYKKKDSGTDYLSEGSEKEEKIDKTLDWVAFKNQFFSCVFIAHQDFTDVTLASKPLEESTGYLKDYSAEMKTFFDPTGKTPTQMQLYFGPNKYRLLQDMNKLSASDKDLDLEHLVYLGWPLFRWINRFFTIYLFDWLSGLGLSMGIVLLLLTIIVKVLVYPTTKKSYMSSAKMRVLKPKIDEISAKYPNKEDAMKKQQETMALYSQYGVSPMGGCLPMLLQMPIWIALFNFVPNAIELRGQKFLWANDLSSYDDVISWNTHVWGLGNHLSIFCLLFCLTNIVNTWISMRQQKDSMAGQNEQMKMMQYMMYFMPLMFFFMFNDYSSGLNYYYFVSGLISILIMWYLRKSTDDSKLLAKLEANYQANKANPQKKTSGLAARLDALQKQQQAMQEAQKKK